MNIIFATNDYMEHGGFHSYLKRVTRALHEMGHKIIIVKCGKKNIHRFEAGIEIWQVQTPYFPGNKPWINVLINNMLISWRVNKKIKEILKTNVIDIIQFTSLKSLPILYFGKVPAVMRLSSYTKKAYPTFETFSKEEVKTMSFLEVWAGKRCNAVFAPSVVTANAYEMDYKKRVYIIESPFINDVKAKMNQEIVQSLSSKRYVLFFGNLYHEKGILIIAKMIQRFLENNPEYTWVFAGKASYISGKDAVRILSDAAGINKERIIFLGELSHEQLYPVIQEADFVVLPSIMENLSNACIEAMYFSKIVIGTDGASFEQLIEHRVSGLLCQIGDSEDLLDKMQEVVNMPDVEKRKIESRAHERIERLRPEIAVKKLVRFYKAVIENAK